MPDRYSFLWWYLAILLAANLALLLPHANLLRVAGAILLIGLWPGLSWVNRFLPDSRPLLRLALAAALSYTITSLTTLLLHYLPGPVQVWQLLAVLNVLAIVPLFVASRDAEPQENRGEFLNSSLPSPHPFAFSRHLPLLFILAIAIFLRVANLHYSEFQGDEALAMISAAEALEGHQDALFLRSKGPGEVLLPMALWRLTETITEAIARLPFTLAGLLALITIYLIGQYFGGRRVGWLAAGFFAFNGFMVAFGRIVQYQALVVWMSAIAFLMTLYWQSTRQLKFAILSGLFLGTGLLAHYDAILVLPAIGWLLVTTDNRQRLTETFGNRPSSFVVRQLVALVLFVITLLLTTLPFYLPYMLDPQANRTGAYVGQRIGNELRNNLSNFFHFTTFYSSSYYLIITGLLVVGLLIGWIWRARWSRWPVPVLLTAGLLAVVFQPDLLNFESSLNLAVFPFGLTFLAAFFALPLGSTRQALIIWLAVPFLGYNFVVALGLTHIYTTVPAWSLLAALIVSIISDKSTLTIYHLPLTNLLIAFFFLSSAVFLWNAFVRHDVEYWQDYPHGNLFIFWTPYPEPPQAGFFGFAHRTGWKAVGQKMAAGELSGDYGSNEEPDVTTWYTRGAPRACDPRPEFYFLADDLIDPIPTPNDVIDSHYQQIGTVTLPNQKQMQIVQLSPVTKNLGQLDEIVLAAKFNQTATPAAFSRSARGSRLAEANFGNLVQLIGYDLDTRRAYPGGRVPVTLYWQVLAPFSSGYQIFTHLESASGPVAQSDGVPVCWTYPTNAWRTGQIIADQHAISLPPDTPPGEYPLEIGLYLPDTFERLDVLDEAGNPAGTSVTLDIVEIRPSGD